jgi:hypothetical protein
MRQRRTLKTAAANYQYLRGLFFVPLGTLFVVAALGNWEVGPLRHAWTFPLAIAVIGAACVPISRFYNDNYGRISQSAEQQARGAAAVVAGLAVVVVGSLLLRSRVSWSLDLPVNATAVTFAVVMLISYAVGVGLRAHHVAIWGALLVGGAVPLWDGSDPSNVGLVLAGGALMLCGVFDHRLFVDTFGAPGALDLEERDVGA